MKFFFASALVFACLACHTAFGQTTAENLIDGMNQLEPSVKEHLTQVVSELSSLPTGKFLFERISPALRFSSKPMRNLGYANGHDTITLEELRLTSTMDVGNSERIEKTRLCFTGEILSHELTHNAQFRAGLFNYPEGCNGYQAFLFEKLLELQAKNVGEKAHREMRSKPDFARYVQEKPRLFLVLASQSKDPDKEYVETLWLNNRTSSSGIRLYREQITEVANWNKAYAFQAFANNHRLFLLDGQGAGEEAVKAHLSKIIDFTGMKVKGDFLLENAPVKPIPRGIACYENGQKVMELEAVADGIERRDFSGSSVRLTKIKF